MDSKTIQERGVMESRFWKGMLTGLVVGSVASIIFMPESGRKVADKIREEAKVIKEKVKKRGKEYKETMDDEVESFVNALVDQGRITEDQSEDFYNKIAKIIK